MAVPKVCSVEGCGKPARTKGWCNAHHMRWLKHGDPLTCLNIIDGRKKHPLYRTWAQMNFRCYGERGATYHCYGGRGITVCERWRGQSGFWNFVADVGQRPKGHTLERIDNDGNYEPGNVVWATMKQQGRNRRTNRLLTVDGVSKTIAEWAEDREISQGAIIMRIRRGWSEYDAVNRYI